jgi:hypothetical protein
MKENKKQLEIEGIITKVNGKKFSKKNREKFFGKLFKLIEKEKLGFFGGIR